MMNANPYIYVIEDEESISKLICMYLKKASIETKPFYNAEDALETIEIPPSDLYHLMIFQKITVDFRLVDGIE